MRKLPNPQKTDQENPEWTAADFRKARSAAEVLPAELLAVLPKRKRGERGKQTTPTKVAVTVRYSREVVDYFRNTGQGWQVRMDDALKEWVKKHPRVAKQ